MEKSDTSLRSLLFSDNSDLGASLSSATEKKHGPPEASPHTSEVGNIRSGFSPSQRKDLHSIPNMSSYSLSGSRASPQNTSSMFSPSHTPFSSKNLLASPAECPTASAYHPAEVQCRGFQAASVSLSHLSPKIKSDSPASVVASYHQTSHSSSLVNPQSQSYSKVSDIKHIFSSDVQCSNPSMLNQNSLFMLSDTNTAAHEDNMIPKLSCATESFHESNHPLAAQSHHSGLSKTDTSLCKSETGLSLNGCENAASFLGQPSQPQSCQNMRSLTPKDSSSTVVNFFPGGSNSSSFTPPSVNSSSSGDESSVSTHFLGDPGGGRGEGMKPSYPDSLLAGQLKTDVIHSQMTQSTAGSFLEENSNNKSDSGFGDVSSNASQDSQHSPPCSYVGLTPWTDKLTMPEFQPLPLPASDILPLPLGHVPNSSITALSAGHMSPRADKQHQPFSTLQPGFGQELCAKIAHQKQTRPSSMPGSQRTGVKTIPNKEHRFKRTADALHKSGLWEVAMKTGSLIKRNRELQKELDQFKVEALSFLKSVIKNPQNRDFIKNVLNNALLSNPTPKNRSVMTAVVSAAVKLEADTFPSDIVKCKMSVAEPVTEANSAFVCTKTDSHVAMEME
ncbi:uncharacterized protein LOC101850040 isoform X2 [Aplysia californica]|uniref:Uncharacterized protein LOC101850040 isoform X2 n=1 Tax=Aplysia californica TaxID=6500 RepID=A0ABM0K667_APLCA|nr:uncharacterized protein LOC101850040 isoform X2 [Aplysia californica]